MPSKTKKNAAAASKKADQKRKNKLVEDKTFGLKNKNKSKKVQEFVKSTTARYVLFERGYTFDLRHQSNNLRFVA